MERMSPGFIGCGAMGSAIIKGIINKNIMPAGNIWAYDLFHEKTKLLKNDYNVNIASDYTELLKKSSQIFLAVKPGDFKSLLEKIKPYLRNEHIFISIAAGVSTAFIESRLGGEVRVIRLMPNTPCLIGEGVVVLSSGKFTSKTDMDAVEEMVKCLGMTLNLKEEYMNAVTALSGSGPGYVFLFLEALVDGGVNVGLDRQTATDLAVQTLSGAAKMVQATGKSLPELKSSVTSPGGTTIAALKIFEENAFRGTVMNAVTEATRRAKEIEGNQN